MDFIFNLLTQLNNNFIQLASLIMCFYKYQNPEVDNEFFEVGDIKLNIVQQIVGKANGLIVLTDRKLSANTDPFEETLQTTDSKQALLQRQQKQSMKPGTAHRIPLEGGRFSQLVLAVMPDMRNNVLGDFLIHKALISALDLCFETAINIRVAVAMPRLSVLELEESMFFDKLVDSLKVFLLKRKKGILTIQLPGNLHDRLKEEVSRAYFQGEDCEEW